MKIKSIISYILIILSINAFAEDKDNISLGCYILNEPAIIPTEASSLLEGKLKKVVSANGFSDNQATGRFAFLAKCDILQKDIIASTPTRISQKIEISYYIVDLIDNKIYGSCEMTVSGIGTNETTAFSSAFQKVSVQNRELKDMLSEAKQKILSYYTTSCTQIITEASTLASIGQYDKAIFSLMSVPPICTECFEKCQSYAVKIYQQKIDYEASNLLERAKNLWAISPTESTAVEISNLITDIDPRFTNYNDVIQFRTSVSKKLTADAQREWNLKIKKDNDNQKFKQSIVDSCRSVGERFANNFHLPHINFLKIY